MPGAILSLVVLFAISRIYKFCSGVQAVGHIPGIRCAFGTRSSLGLLLPTRLNFFFTNIGTDYEWERLRTDGYERDTGIISVVPWLHGTPTILVSSAGTIQQILEHSNGFDKTSPDDSATSYLFGRNLVVVQKEEWKKHRRVLSPAFSNNLYSMVWKESIRTFRDMIEAEEWEKQENVVIPVLNDLISKFTLSIIASCAFDFRPAWSDSFDMTADGMNLPSCFKVMVRDAQVFALTPTWAYALPFKLLRRVDTASRTIFSFMRSQISLRREKIANEDVAGETSQGKHTIFNNIIRASTDSGKFAFGEDEVIGNTFIMLFAGHETTARTLTALLALLALYPDEQDKVCQEIERVLPDRRDPDFEDYDSFTQIRNCIQETMRLYPPVTMLIREAIQDTHLDITSYGINGKGQSVVIKKGSHLIGDIVGMHYNPNYFPEPEAFKPSRWDDDTINKDAFVGFGQGPRACIGRKFSLAEATCFIIMLLRDWRVKIDLGKDETPQQWQRRVMTGTMTGPGGLGPISVKFSKRTRGG
ncbi:hypothetical protein BOTBODRAFT_115251 [Botryobasidium botryosum FD-172 SS1]|uniref:Cytochrome P450 n=1 Tax=Botryobasidium botryosum (strain FD-172 SS1) TaxID=930990 RepID=A0A067M7R8_BOTB1|nr:hypothetical protein BOTBODRAFT_115251 [Botryobasidium botryosum FD-172 SS1]